MRKSAGLDDIPASLLKFCAPDIACSRACLFNRIFELSEFPQAWNNALVIPICKKGPNKLPADRTFAHREQNSRTDSAQQALRVSQTLAD